MSASPCLACIRYQASLGGPLGLRKWSNYQARCLFDVAKRGSSLNFQTQVGGDCWIRMFNDGDCLGSSCFWPIPNCVHVMLVGLADPIISNKPAAVYG